MGYTDFKFDAHKGFESIWAQAMMYNVLLRDSFEPETYICSPLRAETVKGKEMNISRIVGNNRILIAIRRCILFSVQLFKSTDEYFPFLADFIIR